MAPVVESNRIHELSPQAQQIISPSDVPSQNWFPVQVVQFNDPGEALAYLISCDSKNVLVSGKIPITITDGNVHQLSNALHQSADGPREYERSLHMLQQLRPNLWLTTRPKYGQNANIYGSEWKDVIEANLNLVRDLQSSTPHIP